MSDSATALVISQQQAANPRRTSYLSNIHSQHFDIAAELTAANASIHNGRSAQLTPSILKSPDSVFSYPFLHGSTFIYGQSFDFSPAHSANNRPVQPFFLTAEEAQPMQSRLEGLALDLEGPMVAAGNLITVFNQRNEFLLVPSTYGSYVTAFEVRELSAFTLYLRERFGDIVSSAHDACQDLLVELTTEFKDVMDQIRDLAKHEDASGMDSLLRESTKDRGLPPASLYSPPQTINRQDRDQDLNWQASTLKDIHRRRNLMVQHLNLLSKSRMVNAPNPGPYIVRKLGYGLDASFLDCLQIEGKEWERLWDFFHVECERVRLTRKRLSTLAKLWGVQFETPEDNQR